MNTSSIAQILVGLIIIALLHDSASALRIRIWALVDRATLRWTYLIFLIFAGLVAAAWISAWIIEWAGLEIDHESGAFTMMSAWGICTAVLLWTTALALRQLSRRR